MKLDTRPYRITGNKPVKLKKMPTRIEPLCEDKKEYEQGLRAQVKAMRLLHEMLFARNSHSLLFIFQAMDAAGKDSAIKHVLSGLNPQGCQVTSFAHPGPRELDHDFLWRTTRFLPARGRIGIFNRSYYEEVLVVRVHPEILAAQRIPDVTTGSPALWKGRFRSIAEHEAHLHRNGTHVVKFFLHLSREEQRERFLKRIDRPDKHWKFSAADLTARDRWDDYRKAYEECIAATATPQSPWYVIPADHKPDARLLISQVILDTLKSLKLSYPEPTAQALRELKAAGRKLRRETD